MKRIYLDFVEDILQSIIDVEEFTANLTFEQFQSDKKTTLASLASLQIIGEASNKIPLEIRNKYPEIPWRAIIGLRNKLVHEYFGVNQKVIWQIINNDLSKLKPQIKNIIEEQKEEK